MWVTLCLLPQAVAVNQDLIYVSLPDHIWVIITYMGLDRDPFTCSSRGKCLLVEKEKWRQDDGEHGGRMTPWKSSSSDV